MKKLVFALALLVPVTALVALASDESKQDDAKVSSRTVLVPQDTSPFKVQMNQQVRIAAEGIAGSKLMADVDGPAQIVAENRVVTIKNGHILIGMTKAECEIKPTGQGTVKVKITVTPPQPNAQPTVQTYEFEVQ